MHRGATPQEERALRKQLEEGVPPECPRCETDLGSTLVPPRSDVSYVRNRVLLTCEVCGLRVVLDKK